MAYKTPGVYVEEIPLLPPSIAEVETAIPAFIGYTVKAEKNNVDLTLQPLKISSLNDFENYFGTAPATTDLVEIDVTEISISDSGNPPKKKHISYSADVKKVLVNLPKNILYYAMQIFFDNGGGQCYIVSIGKADGKKIDAADFNKGLDAIRNFDEPTLLVAPEAVYLDAKYESFYQAMIKQASELKDRFVIVDTLEPKSPADITADQEGFRALSLGTKEQVRYAAVYYPWLNSSINYNYSDEITIKSGKIVDASDPTKEVDLAGKKISEIKKDYDELYQLLTTELSKKLTVIMPPSGAVAGAYAYVDSTRGVWKAPANVVLKSVMSPSVQISLEQQRDLNVHSSGISINAIRFIAGSGITIWGARTIDGNNREWRYVNVRRFFNMVEESMQKSTLWAVFEPNTKNTWVKVKSMIESYLLSKWIEGALAGSKPEEAFFVKVGLPETMSSDEVLDGIMRVKIGLAVSRPAEFIIIQFTHKQQTS
ncbi:MAG TPA: phage tail sheath C-terminal domain-containing protein [Chitinophagaceae bacterium]